MRIRILSLADVIEDLETLYLKTTNFYGQARKTIEAILLDSSIRFSVRKVHDNLRDIFSIPSSLFIGANPEPENQLKIEDLLSRAIAKAEHSSDEESKSLYTRFIRLFKSIHQIRDLLERCYSLGYDVENHFLDERVSIRDSDLGPVDEFKSRLQDYMQDLKEFLSKEDRLQNLNIKDFVTGKMLKNAKLGELGGLREYIDWWSHRQLLDATHAEVAKELLGAGHSLDAKGTVWTNTQTWRASHRPGHRQSRRRPLWTSRDREPASSPSRTNSGISSD